MLRAIGDAAGGQQRPEVCDAGTQERDAAAGAVLCRLCCFLTSDDATIATVLADVAEQRARRQQEQPQACQQQQQQQPVAEVQQQQQEPVQEEASSEEGTQQVFDGLPQQPADAQQVELAGDAAEASGQPAKGADECAEAGAAGAEPEMGQIDDTAAAGVDPAQELEEEELEEEQPVLAVAAASGQHMETVTAAGDSVAGSSEG